VHAWVNVNLVADATSLPVGAGHVVRRHPDWLMVPAELAGLNPRQRSFLPRLVAWTRGQAASVEGLFTSPLVKPAADHVVDVVKDIATHYAVDGMHFDYIRYPGARFDYSRKALAAFRDDVAPSVTPKERQALDRQQRAKPMVWTDRYPDRWANFRRARLTSLLARLRAAARAARPGVLVSAAVMPEPRVAVEDRLQDWPSWLSSGLLDVVCPMAYTDDLATFRRQIERARSLSHGRQVWAGIGAYRLTGDQALSHIEAARSIGIEGVVLFSYDSLVSAARGADNLARIGQQAFGQ
jgi:uncharacterized lipoprotein YddW (UPF0748 family)